MATKLYSVPGSKEPDSGQEARPLVLVVDDDDTHRSDLRDLLGDDGYDVVEAANGKAALDFLVSRRDRIPSAMILDLSMPVMSGWELLAVIKAYVRFAKIPVILVSGVPPQLDPVKHGAIDAYFRKPYEPKDLLAAVAK